MDSMGRCLRSLSMSSIFLIVWLVIDGFNKRSMTIAHSFEVVSFFAMSLESIVAIASLVSSLRVSYKDWPSTVGWLLFVVLFTVSTAIMVVDAIGAILSFVACLMVASLSVSIVTIVHANDVRSWRILILSISYITAIALLVMSAIMAGWTQRVLLIVVVVCYSVYPLVYGIKDLFSSHSSNG